MGLTKYASSQVSVGNIDLHALTNDLHAIYMRLTCNLHAIYMRLTCAKCVRLRAKKHDGRQNGNRNTTVQHARTTII